MTSTGRRAPLPMRIAGHSGSVRAHRLRRKLFRYDEALASRYLAETREPRLHIGGGEHRLDGGLNTDLGACAGVMILGATRPFPFADPDGLLD